MRLYKVYILFAVFSGMHSVLLKGLQSDECWEDKSRGWPAHGRRSDLVVAGKFKLYRDGLFLTYCLLYLVKQEWAAPVLNSCQQFGLFILNRCIKSMAWHLRPKRNSKKVTRWHLRTGVAPPPPAVGLWVALLTPNIDSIAILYRKGGGDQWSVSLVRESFYLLIQISFLVSGTHEMHTIWQSRFESSGTFTSKKRHGH